jgi:hypothetical protein
VTPSTPSQPDAPAGPGDLPHVFVDRSLGAVQVPTLLRQAGFVLTTMREHYGEAQAQQVTDVEWIALTAQRGWIGFHKDAEIRRNEVERRAVLDTGARMFCVPRADITAADVAARFIRNLGAPSWPQSKNQGPTSTRSRATASSGCCKTSTSFRHACS